MTEVTGENEAQNRQQQGPNLHGHAEESVPENITKGTGENEAHNQQHWTDEERLMEKSAPENVTEGTEENEPPQIINNKG